MKLTVKYVELEVPSQFMDTVEAYLSDYKSVIYESRPINDMVEYVEIALTNFEDLEALARIFSTMISMRQIHKMTVSQKEMEL